MQKLISAIKCLDYLGETTKRTVKADLLASAADNPILKEMFSRTYDWEITYGLTLKMPKIPKMASAFSPSYSLEDEWTTFLMLLDELAARNLSGLEAVETINRFLLAVDPHRAEWYGRIINRDLKVGVRVATYGDIWPDLRSEFGVSLAEKFDSTMELKYPLAIEPKLDGLRIATVFREGHRMAKTRGDLQYNEICKFVLGSLEPHVTKNAVDGELMADWELTGPLSTYGGTRYKSPWGKTQGMLKTGMYKNVFNPDRVTPELWEEIRTELKFWAFDQISLDVYNPAISMDKRPFYERRAILAETVEATGKDVKAGSTVAPKPPRKRVTKAPVSEKPTRVEAEPKAPESTRARSRRTRRAMTTKTPRRTRSSK